MERINLGGKWKLTGKRAWQDNSLITLDTTVPGEAQLALIEEGILPKDIYMGKNLKALEEYEDYEWWYERTIVAPKNRTNIWLVFKGVDCVAEYYLNGVKFAESDNAFIAHEFRVDEYLNDGENLLTVHIKSHIAEIHKTKLDLFDFAATRKDTSDITALRRPIHTYGWDIMPRCVTAGIWRDVYLEVRDKIYFTQAYFDFRYINLNWVNFYYETESEFKDFKNVTIKIDAVCGDSEIHVENNPGYSKNNKIAYKSGCISFDFNDAKLWWPIGYGEQNIYDASIKILSDEKLVHEFKTCFAIRNIELERTALTDGKNGYFRFKINGEEIMCKGTNWVPLDAFHSRDKERLLNALNLAKDCGCNTIRCWGGNVYEDHEFFDFCDESGIMVWQDFAFACYNYPQGEWFTKKVEKEVEYIVKEYRRHPSIILWCGDNEIDYPHTAKNILPSMNILSRKVIPETVRKHDIMRPYLESSPYISDEIAVGYNESSATCSSEAHLWGCRAYYKSDFFKQSKAHFVSEIGYHGCPSFKSIRKFITNENVWPYNNSEWALHSTDWQERLNRVTLMEKQVRQMFGFVPNNPDDYALASQISQAEAFKYFIERMRIDRPNKSGVIWWNLLDGWPQMSDAVVDYYYEKKLAYHYIKRVQKPFIVAVGELNDWYMPVYLCNDTLVEKKGNVKIYDADTKKVLLEKEFTAPKNTSVVLDYIEGYYYEKKLLIIEWEVDGEKGYNHYLMGSPAHDFEKYKNWIKKSCVYEGSVFR